MQAWFGIALFMLALTTRAAGLPDEARETVKAFFAQEAKRSVIFPTPEDAPFDVIFIHVCSLSWDDVRAAGLENHPLWRDFDFLFTRFNAVSTYSGPAARRILRSACGQSTHSGLYDPVEKKCYLMEDLEDAGFTPSLALNHDGSYGGFLASIREQGGMDIPPMPDDGLPLYQHAFDGSPVYDDLSVLSRWLDLRQQNPAARMALYYNTISLHDGNHLLADGSRPSRETYGTRLSALLSEVEEFMQKIAAAGKKAVVVMIPEHGAALRGGAMQAAGSHEFPSPRLNLVPVGIKAVGAKRIGSALRIDLPASFLAANTIVARMLAKSPFAAEGFSAIQYAEDLPETNFVGENRHHLILEMGGRLYLRGESGEWSEYPTPH